MDTEIFSFVLWTAALGMAVVFAFLVLLSLLMSSISAVDRLAVGASTRTAVRASTAAVPDATLNAAEATPPSWAVAAAVAYIELEHAAERTSAAAWTARIAR